MIITVSGKPGSGKSTLAKRLAEHFGFEYHSTGELMRQIAKEKGISLLELSRHAEKDKSIDNMIDERTKKLGNEKDNFVMDSRLAWNFIPKAIKIFIDISEKEAAKRVFEQQRHDEKENISFTRTLSNQKKRFESEKKRYQKLYGLDYTNKKNFDIVINNSRLSAEQTFEKAVREIEKLIGKKK